MVSALSIALEKAGNEVKIIMPRYYKINRDNLTKIDAPLGVPCGWQEQWCGV